jgi:regulator of sigma E protease
MNIILFIIVLGVLILVHELGHVLAAKLFGIRVDTFAIGFPPTLWKKKKGEVTYKLNAIPIGGYVSIHGENPDPTKPETDKERSLIYRPAWQQLIVFFAGVFMNFALAWVLLIVVFSLGGSKMLIDGEKATPDELSRAEVVALQISENGPLAGSDMIPGSVITKVMTNDKKESLEGEALTDLSFVEFVGEHNPVVITYIDGEEVLTTQRFYKELFGENEEEKLGVAVGLVLKEEGKSFVESIVLGSKRVVSLTKEVCVIFWELITGKTSATNLVGPVGLVGVVGSAAQDGLVSLLMIVILISINLAILNLIPIPALDGGRMLFVIIEWIKGSRLPTNAANIANTIGFFLLIGIMILVTVMDIIRVVS